MSTHVLHMTRLHAKRPLLVELRVINGPFEGGCRLQSGGGAWGLVGVQHIRYMYVGKVGYLLSSLAVSAVAHRHETREKIYCRILKYQRKI